MTTEECIEQTYEKSKILTWLINGYGRLGISITSLPMLTKEWIIKNYNVELEYFKEPE